MNEFSMLRNSLVDLSTYILVTAKEIYHALKENQGKSRRMLCFFRELIDIDQLGPIYCEKDHIEECNRQLSELKADLRHAIDPSDIYTYQVCSLITMTRIV
jgi:hypothetical protein